MSDPSAILFRKSSYSEETILSAWSTTCTILIGTGEFCGSAVPPGSPISACGPHLASAFRFCQDALDHATDVRAGFDPTERAEQIQLRIEATRSVVYYARCGALIKIGTTRNMAARKRAIKADEILAVENGSFDLEHRRHDQFAHLRTSPRNELFRPGADLLAHIATLT